MADDKSAKQRRPGEKRAGKFHYNPGNMSGKTADNTKPEEEQRTNRDRIRSRAPLPKSRGR
ncbi:MAG: hypothetical protein NW223_03720 [Hyphomicrobiaceae bacterium]|nr:hypothetical protein [Hyphomicrobiaceae bacterium]